MTQLSANEATEPRAAAAHVPLSERPLVADDENTVISSPEQPRPELKQDAPATTPNNDGILNRLFPPNHSFKGEEVGIRLAHFEITGRLGSGGMGAVFKATDLELARDVALKVLNPSSSQDPSLIARFRNEARACAQLNHDNIARVYYADSQNGMYFIAYEYASGLTIRDLIVEKGCLSPADTINYAIQVTLALNHIAAAGIVHRDIKPSNIMLTTSGRVKVVDLGLARRETTDSIGDITVVGTTLGTFDYIAPEQARDPRNADERSDIYSLGCTMYHMLTGRPPYPEGTALQKLLDHQGKSAPDPRALNSSIPEELAAIMRKMMANDPEVRYQAPGLLLNDLIQMAQMLGLQSVPAEGIVWRKFSPAGSKQPLGAVWVFVSVLLICLTAVFLHHVPRIADVADDGFNDANIGVSVPVFSEHETKDQGSPSVENTVSIPPGTPRNPAPSVNVKDTDPSIGTNDPSAAVIPSPMTFELPFPLAGPVSSSVFRLGMMQLEPPARDSDSVATAGPFMLLRSSGDTASFWTLKAAVSDARSGDAVLLRYNGYPDDLKSQPPIRIVGTDLIIRAEEGYRPTLVFDGATEGTVSPGQMISLRGNGKLTLLDVDLRAVVGDNFAADRWSLFHCTGPNTIELSGVTIDFLNPDGQPAALFDLAGESSGSESGTARETEISLNRVLCRAESDGFEINSQARGRIRLQNCGIALSGSLVKNLGDSSMATSRGKLDILLNHMTCLTSAPMLTMDDSDNRRPGGMQRLMPTLSVRSEGCVFAAQGTDRRLMLTDGTSISEDLETLVSWNGFDNLYDRFEIYWQIATPTTDFAPRRLDFAEWVRNWKDRSDSEETNANRMPEFAWKNGTFNSDTRERWIRNLTLTDFELNPLQTARDGLVPGVNVAELPSFPQLPAVTPSPLMESSPNSPDIPATATDSKPNISAASVPSRKPDEPAHPDSKGSQPTTPGAPLGQQSIQDLKDK